MNPPMKLHHAGYITEGTESVARVYIARFWHELVTGIIHDPNQTANVQFLKISTDPTYPELVSPDGPDSKLMGAIKRRGAINHLCYITACLEVAIAHLEQEGMRLISTLLRGCVWREANLLAPRRGHGFH